MEKLSATPRISSIDILRGLIIIVMGFDHVRDFVAVTPFDVMDVSKTTPGWFLSRWMTHYCAPTFVFLAGVSAFIYGRKVSKGELSKFLWTRGLWLIFIEFTFVHFGWTFDFAFFFVQVIWVIGWSMIILSGLIYLPTWFIISFTVILIGGHNLLDSIQSNNYGWQLLHQQYWGPPVAVVYPLVPWPAVMSFGYLIGHYYSLGATRRQRNLLLTGISLIVCFLLLRFINLYGDRQPWAYQSRGWLYTFLDFLDTTKYPPSFQFVCMTLGPALIALSFLENAKGKIINFLQTFGRVPFFYYVVHIYAIHSLTLIYNGVRYGEWRTWLFDAPPAAYKPSLLTAYVAWSILTVIMYFLCRWFSGLKKRYSYWWLKYL